MRHRDLGQIHFAEDRAARVFDLSQFGMIQVDQFNAEPIGHFIITKPIKDLGRFEVLIAAPFADNDLGIAASLNVSHNRLDAIDRRGDRWR